MGQARGRPMVSHQNMQCCQISEDNDDHQNEDSDGQTDGNKDFLLWERRGWGGGCQGNSGVEGGATQGEGWRGKAERLTLRAFFWFSAPP